MWAGGAGPRLKDSVLFGGGFLLLGYRLLDDVYRGECAQRHGSHDGNSDESPEGFELAHLAAEDLVECHPEGVAKNLDTPIQAILYPLEHSRDDMVECYPYDADDENGEDSTSHTPPVCWPHVFQSVLRKSKTNVL
ncbi:MAG: hypothetical protein HHAS10_12230 [Candidatus Altimarinota bacterium]